MVRPINTQEQRAHAIKLLLAGTKLAQTSRESGLYLDAVRELARTLGIATKNGPTQTYTPEAVAKVYRSLGSVQKTADRLGVTRNNVYVALRKLGVIQRDVDKRNAEHSARLVEATRMRAEGLSLRVIADKFDVARSTVSDWLKDK